MAMKVKCVFIKLQTEHQGVTSDRKQKLTREEADKDKRPEEEDESGSYDGNRHGKETV